MSEEENRSNVITLFKTFGLYQIVTPKSPKIFNFNVYILIIIFLSSCTTIMILIGLPGIFLKIEEPTGRVDNGFKSLQTLFCLVCIIVGNLKITSIIINKNKIFKLLNLAHESFLLSVHSKIHTKRLKHGKHFKLIVPVTAILIFVSLFLWLTSPIVLNGINSVQDKSEININTRKLSPVNLKFPVKTTTYNRWFFGFYLTESILMSYSIYCMVLFDIYLFSLLQLITNYYTTVTAAFECFNFRGKINDGKWIICM